MRFNGQLFVAMTYILDHPLIIPGRSTGDRQAQVWSIEDMVELTPLHVAGKRGPYKKRRKLISD